MSGAKQPPGSLEYARVPPQAPEMEGAVLGAILLEKDKLGEVEDILTPGPAAFYVDAHQKIYAAILSLAGKQLPVDILTVTSELRASNDLELVGGAYYVTQLTRDVVTAANVDTHARLIMEKWMKRELIRMAGETLKAAYEDGTDVFDLLDSTEQQLAMMSLGAVQGVYDNAKSLADAQRKRFLQQASRPDELTGVDTGYPALNRLAGGGLQPADVIYLAARPSVGKTAFALNIALNAMRSRKRTGVGFFSVEMPKERITRRMLAAMARVWMDSIKTGQMDVTEADRMARALDEFDQLPFFIDDTSGISIQQFRSKARRMVLRDGVGLIMIDYIQLMTAQLEWGGNREQELSRISREIKALAKELHIPIVVLSQLNRGIEIRKESKTPQLSDLRESGSLEQDADIVGILTRPDYQMAEGTMDLMFQHDATLHIKKSRDGEVDDLLFRFLKKMQLWLDPAQYDRFEDPNAPFHDSGSLRQMDDPRAGIQTSYNLPRPTSQPRRDDEDDNEPPPF